MFELSIGDTLRSEAAVRSRRDFLVEEARRLVRQSAFARPRAEHSAELIVALEAQANDLASQANILSWVLGEDRKTAVVPKISQ